MSIAALTSLERNTNTGKMVVSSVIEIILSDYECTLVVICLRYCPPVKLFVTTISYRCWLRPIAFLKVGSLRCISVQAIKECSVVGTRGLVKHIPVAHSKNLALLSV